MTQLLWMMYTLEDYGLNYKNFKVLCDNTSSINLNKNIIHHSRSKYIKVKYHFVQDHIAKGYIVFDCVESKSNLANIFTKPLLKSKFSTLRRELGMRFVK